MRTHKLTKKEEQETMWLTVGRLQAALKYPNNTSIERMRELFEKLIIDIENLEKEVK